MVKEQRIIPNNGTLPIKIPRQDKYWPTWVICHFYWCSKAYLHIKKGVPTGGRIGGEPWKGYVEFQQVRILGRILDHWDDRPPLDTQGWKGRLFRKQGKSHFSVCPIYKWNKRSTDAVVKLTNFSTLQYCESNTHSVETVLQILNFDVFPVWR